MHQRSHSGRLSLILLFVCIFAFWWGIATLAQNSKAAPDPTSSTPAAVAAYVPQQVSGPVTMQVAVANDMYTYSGSVPLASSCEQLGEGIAVKGRDPSHITVLLTLTQPATACAEASGGSTSEPFAVSASVTPGTKAILDGITVNGVITPATIQPAGTQ